MTPNFGVKIYHSTINLWSWWWQVDNHKDHLARTILTISVLLLVLLWYHLTELYVRKRRTPLPPGPYGLPVVGYLPFLTLNLHERFTEMSHIYGPIFSLWLGSKLHVVINSVDLAKVVARDLDQTFANRNPPLTALIITYGALDIAWSNHNAHWRTMRKLLVSQVLSNANLDACASFRTNGVRKVVRDIYGRLGESININKVAFDAELNVVMGMLWGCSEGNESSYMIRDGFREVQFKIIELLGAPNISDFIPMLSWFDLQGRQREMQKLKEHLDRIFDNIITGRGNGNYKKMDGDGRKDFLEILLEFKDLKDGPISINIDQIKGLLFDILTAATDTTSSMVEWVMTEILHHPKVKTKIQQELTDVFGTNIVEECHLSKLTYLDAVIKETLRIHPPLPLLFHRCPDESCMVGGYMIPKGTVVFINVWAIHLDPKNWSDPLEFKPERFLKGKWDYNGNNLKFLPFGFGRRICPGIPLGEKMLAYILASLLHSFDWRSPEDEDFEVSDAFRFVIKKRKPLIAIPSQRLFDASLYL